MWYCLLKIALIFRIILLCAHFLCALCPCISVREVCAADAVFLSCVMWCRLALASRPGYASLGPCQIVWLTCLDGEQTSLETPRCQ
jgi:hypothetical protein